MAYPIAQQLFEVAAALLWGGALGLLYDVFRLFRRLLGLTAFFDLLFWVGGTLGLFTLGLGPGGGKLTLPMLCCAAIGAGLYYVGPGVPVRWCCDRLAEAIRRLWKRIFRRRKKAEREANEEE